jgi:hypothetical protein
MPGTPTQPLYPQPLIVGELPQGCQPLSVQNEDQKSNKALAVAAKAGLLVRLFLFAPSCVA